MRAVTTRAFSSMLCDESMVMAITLGLDGSAGDLWKELGVRQSSLLHIT